MSVAFGARVRVSGPRAWLVTAAGSSGLFLITLGVVESQCCGIAESSLRDWYFHLFRTALPTDMVPVFQGISLDALDHPEAATIALSVSFLVLLVCIFVFRFRRLWSAVLMVASPVAAAVSALGLKSLIARPPPLNTYNGHSLPSGHAAASAALALCLIYGVWRLRIPSVVRRASLGAVAITFALVTLSTLTLHYPSDVLAGDALGAAWAGALAALLWPRLQREVGPDLPR